MSDEGVFWHFLELKNKRIPAVKNQNVLTHFYEETLIFIHQNWYSLKISKHSFML